MSEIQVTPAAVTHASVHVSGIAGHVNEMHGRMGRHGSAGQATPAAGAVEGLMGRWSQALPLYAEAGSRLTAALAAAARGYSITDGDIADAASGGPGDEDA